MDATDLPQSRSLSFNGALTCMILATALWALSFVAPLWLDACSPVEITVGRFFFYGLVSIAALLTRYRNMRLRSGHWMRAALYGFVGNILFSLLVSFGVQDTGAEVVVPITGLIPICISVAGSGALTASAWRKLLVPFLMLAIGLGVVLVVQSGILDHDARLSWPGVGAVVVTVVTWTWYALSNARFLRAHPSISGAQWSCAVGAATFALGAVIVCVASLSGHGLASSASIFHGQSGVLFMLTSAALGLGASWFGAVLFNRASHVLPMSLVGQLIVLETVFGIVYTCMWKQTMPPITQAAGMVLAIAGIWLSARELLK
ncbi:DMT family transporter [Paraburkholderia sp. J94]|uniref:DMT family transporter n=1 Tax=Paraburkholderia sp. J94 TaxID=2805441 RepID=UPI002AB0B216|nr:DMT family transporter [Paraburkholderia sp. J94]